MISKKSITVLIIIIGIGSVFGFKSLHSVLRKPISRDYSLNRVKGGGSNAPIKIKEFIDFQCPACAKGALYLKDLIEKYPDDIRLEVKHFPLKMHAHGLLSAKYAQCAARQGKFWSFHDKILLRQHDWSSLIDVAPAFNVIAEQVNLNQQELDSCLEDKSTDINILKDKEEGTALGVRSTPTYVVNGELIVGKISLEIKMNKLLEEIHH